eukprot:TRINITY_DN653_c0_g2_i2.p1 TRINITY_DN653_c0_g2~~TRINITY_DN653_c0_g2_i2.p1  ORF type:complete len:735 (+),score=219.36 TRINITY_DN653_c0_g2_i2:66-2270(+)
MCIRDRNDYILSNGLYVVDIPEHVQQHMLREYFRQCGNVATVIIPRKPNSSGKRYGFVYYSRPEEAKQARAQLNYKPIYGSSNWITIKPCIELQEINKEANVFINHLPEHFQEPQLDEAFRQFGDILSIFLMRAKDQRSLGYGYVQFRSVESADASVAEMNGKQLQPGKELVVQKFKKREERLGDEENRNLFISNLPQVAKPQENDLLERIKSEFSQFGEITSAIVKGDDPSTPESKRKGLCAFVCFKNANEAAQALESLSGSEFLGIPIKVSLHKSRRQRMRLPIADSNLYVYNLKKEVDEEAVRQAFTNYGPIASIRIFESARDKCKFGYVDFREPADAKKVVNAAGNPNEKPLVQLFVNEEPKISFYVSKEQRDKEKNTKTRQPKNNQFPQPIPYPYMYPMPFPGYMPHPPHMPPMGAGMMPAQMAMQGGPQPQMGMPGMQPPPGGLPPGHHIGPNPNVQPGMGPMPGGPMPQPQFANPIPPQGNLPPRQPPFPQGPKPNQPPFDQNQGQFQPRPHGAGRGMSQGGRGAGYHQGPPGNRPPHLHQPGQPPVGNMGMPMRPHQGGSMGRGGPRPQHPQGNMGQPIGGGRGMGHPGPAPQAGRPGAPPQGTQAQNTVAMIRADLPKFLSLPDDDKRKILGELLFPKVQAELGPGQAVNAPKITGMLMDFDVMEVDEILTMLENREDLSERVQEAMDLIQGTGGNQTEMWLHDNKNSEKRGSKQVQQKNQKQNK